MGLDFSLIYKYKLANLTIIFPQNCLYLEKNIFYMLKFVKMTKYEYILN